MAHTLAFRDQENLTHTHQTKAAGKPLNQNTCTLHPKTPGNLKTPFRHAKNDENLPVTFCGKEGIGKDGTSALDKSAFVTPLALRHRAPLGPKTTNAKAQPLQTSTVALTNKPARTVFKHSGARRSAKSKITIAPTEPVDADVLSKKPEQEEGPDFGYAPPPPVELPDPPIEFEEDPELTADILAGHGVPYPYDSPKDENGFSIRLKKEEEEWMKVDKERVEKSLEGLDSVFPSFGELNKQVDDMIAAGPQKERLPLLRVDSIKARSAIAALSEPARLPMSAMRPTQASEQKKKCVLPASKSKASVGVGPTLAVPNRLNHAAVSKNTIGFPKAKKTPSIIPKSGGNTNGYVGTPKVAKVHQGTIHPRDFRDLYGSPPEESDMWFRLKHYELLEKDLAEDEAASMDDDLSDADFFPFDNVKLDDEDFQLPMPE